MKNNFIKFSFVYWIGFIIIIVMISYNDGQEELSNYSFSEGIVVDKIWLPTRGRRNTRDFPFAQWQYAVYKDTFLFVDKTYPVYDDPLGKKRKVIYLKDDHDNARVYSWVFCINLPFLIVATLVAIFIFSIYMFVTFWNDKTWFSRRRY